MEQLKAQSAVGSTRLLGTVWRHKKKGGIYRVTQVAEKRGDVYLVAETKGCRSTWKAECLLPFDYEQVPNTNFLRAASEPLSQKSALCSEKCRCRTDLAQPATTRTEIPL